MLPQVVSKPKQIVHLQCFEVENDSAVLKIAILFTFSQIVWWNSLKNSGKLQSRCWKIFNVACIFVIYCRKKRISKPKISAFYLCVVSFLWIKWNRKLKKKKLIKIPHMLKLIIRKKKDQHLVSKFLCKIHKFAIAMLPTRSDLTQLRWKLRKGMIPTMKLITRDGIEFTSLSMTQCGVNVEKKLPFTVEAGRWVIIHQKSFDRAWITKRFTQIKSQICITNTSERVHFECLSWWLILLVFHEP